MHTRTKLKQTLSALIVFTSVIAGLSSCKKDNDNGPVPPPASTKLSEYRDGEDLLKLDYNADGSVKQVTIKSEGTTSGNLIDYNIAYSNDKKISEVTSSAGEKLIPVYQNGVMTRVEVFEGAEKTGFTDYAYQNNLLKKATIFWGSEDEFLPFLEFQFTYNNAGNLIRTDVLMATDILGNLEPAGFTTYLHDDKVNPLFAYKDLLSLLWVAPSKNNIKQEDHFDADQQLEDRFTYTYTYKANGLPEGGESKNGLPGGPVTTSQIQFIYK